MIKLEVEGYCHKCPDFIPEAYPTHTVFSDHTVSVDTAVRCQNHESCFRKYEYIKSQMEKNDGNSDQTN